MWNKVMRLISYRKAIRDVNQGMVNIECNQQEIMCRLQMVEDGLKLCLEYIVKGQGK